MDAVLQDLRYAVRQLIKSPGFTLVAVATLGLGIGANAGIFTIANTLFFKPPAQVLRPDELVAVYTSDFSGPRYSATSWIDYLDFRRETSDVLVGLASYAPRPFNLSAGGETQRTWGEEVSDNYFDVLGIRPVSGRFFRAEEGLRAGDEPVAVIGDGLWRQRFGSDPALIGRSVRINGHPFTVIGIAPPGFAGLVRGLKTDLWTPFLFHGLLNIGTSDLTSRGSRGLLLIGRLKPGVAPSTAKARFDVLARGLHEAFPDDWTDVQDRSRVITVTPERDARVSPAARGPVIGFIGMLMAVVGLVLLICCANVANLLLARAAGRTHELAVRLALGAKRSRLIRQLLTESVLLAGLGGLAGVLVALWTTGLLMGFQPSLPIPVALDLTPDVRVLGFTVLVALATGIVFGLAPALKATRPDLVPMLKDQTAVLGTGRRRLSLRDALVMGQVAVSLVLLVMAGLFLRSLGKARSMDPGFDPRGIILLSTQLSVQGYDSSRAHAFYEQLLERARGLPGVRAASLAEEVPLSLATGRRGVQIDGYVPRPGEDLEFPANTVSDGYFRAMSIPIVRGREFESRDRAGAPLVAIVNETFARRFWPGQDPLGKRIGWPDAWREVVGIARDGKYGSLGEEPRPYFYSPLAQRPATDLTLHVRAADPAAVQPVLGALVRQLDADLPVRITSMEEHLGLTLLSQRIGATLLGIFGALGVLLASIGLYGVLAYTVARRTREIGVRIALGAAAKDVRRLVVGHALRLVGVGAAVGLVLAFIAGRLAAGFLFGVAPADLVTFVVVPLLLGAVALVASWIPSLRATTLDPIAALRCE
ncbi:MAG TPA: ABC transporter permease [Gemmatimonadales bacterium]